MQFATLFTIATSMALASAGTIKNREAPLDNVATFTLTTASPADDGCNTNSDAAHVVNVASQTVGQCLGGSADGWKAAQLTAISDNYWLRIYTNDNCTTNSDTYGIVAPSECIVSDSGNPWLSYQITLPDQ